MTQASTGVGAQHLVADFETFAASAAGDTWMADVRRGAAKSLLELGLPTTKSEAWRHLSAQKMVPSALGRVQAEAVSASTQAPSFDLATAAWGAVTTIVMQDGRFDAEASDLAALPEGVVVMSLRDAASTHTEVVRQHLAKIDLSTADNAFVGANTAYLDEGVFIFASRNAQCDQPIVCSYRNGGGTDSVRHPRTLLVLEQGASLELWEHFCSAGSGAALNNSVAEFVLGANSRLTHLRLQAEGDEVAHVATVEARLHRDSRLRSHLFTLGGRVARTTLAVKLLGEGAEADLSGLYVTGGQEHADIYTVVEHAVPHCTSRELFKGVLDGRSSSAFNGMVKVFPQAQKTDSSQYNKNLLLSKQAKANTRPQLEIYADDVKCAHGATVGQLDAEQIFYLRSRGIGLAQAKRELTYAFAAEVVEGMQPQSLRVALEGLIRARLTAVAGDAA